MGKEEKIIILGDIHGRNTWDSIIKKENPDKVIFLGDYFDSFDIKPKEQIENFKNILELQLQMGDDACILLYGNHDHHYTLTSEVYSGKNYETQASANLLLKEAIANNNIKLIHVEDNIVFSHAGITNYWLNEIAKLSIEDLDLNTINLNILNWNCIKGYDPYGNTISNSPIWVRPQALESDKLENYSQIVGHTALKGGIHNVSNIYYCDALPKQYLKIVNNVISIEDNV